MKSIAAPLSMHLLDSPTKLTHALKITRLDGVVLAVTSFDANLVIDGDTYLSNPGLEVGNIVNTSGGAVGNMELQTLNDGTVFRVGDVLNGVWRNASFSLHRLNWNSYYDPYFANVSHLLHGQGVEDGTTITNSSSVGGSWTRNGPIVTSARQKKFGVSSISFAQKMGYLSNTYAGNWIFDTHSTVEFWYWADTNSGTQLLIEWYGSTSARVVLRLNAGAIELLTGADVLRLTTTAPAARRWVHVALGFLYGSASVNKFMLFVNGALATSATNVTLPVSSTSIYIGQDGGYSLTTRQWVFNGYMTDIRITDGVCRYTMPFTIPTSAYPESATAHKDTLLTGYIGEITLQENLVVAELRDVRQFLQQPFGIISSKTCRYRFGEARCGVDTVVITVPIANDPAYSYIGSLLHMNGADGSTTITDNAPTPKVWTATNATIEIEQYKFGGASLYCNGTNAYIRTPDNSAFDFGNSDFTIELWIRPDAAAMTGTSVVMTKRTNSSSTDGFWLGFWYGLHFYASSTGSSWDIIDSSNGYFGDLVANTWYHVAISRNGDYWRGYLDGALKWATTASKTILANANSVTIGAENSSANYYKGYIDEVRITKGYGRYPKDFSSTLQAAEWPDSMGASSASITSVTSNQVFTDSGRAEASDYFGEGILTWLTGNNAGLSAKIKSFAAGQFTLALPMYSAVQVGDTYKAVPGCRKRLDEDCKTKWNNVLNFGGEPHRPKIDELTSTP